MEPGAVRGQVKHVGRAPGQRRGRLDGHAVWGVEGHSWQGYGRVDVGGGGLALRFAVRDRGGGAELGLAVLGAVSHCQAVKVLLYLLNLK